MIAQRWLWLAALLAGASYLIPVLAGWQGPAIVAWKGAGVGLLAIWAALNARSADGWLIALVLALGALGDVLIDAMGMIVGGIVFAAGHVIAIGLYVRNQRDMATFSQRLFALALPLLTGILAWQITAATPLAGIAIIYAVLAAVMASSAWLSRFPRYRTGIGAVLFVLSDLALFAGASGIIGDTVRSMLVWPLYFTGQALIAWGVVTTLRRHDAARPAVART